MALRKGSYSDAAEVVTAEPMLDLTSVPTDFDAALEALREAGLEPQVITEFGDGFSVVDKASLVGTAFVIVADKIVKGDFGPMSVIHLVNARNEKGIIVDGSTGILAQHQNLLNVRGSLRGLVVPNGLTRSDYEATDAKGNPVSATTFYLSGL